MLRPCLAAFFTALTAMASPLCAVASDLVIIGPVYTGTEFQPRAGGVAADDGVITFVGSAEEARSLAEDDSVLIELPEGAALYPGFTDSHAHLFGIGQRELTLNLESTASLADLVETVRARAAETPAGETIVGRGWIETHWPEARFPTRQDLDAATVAHPVVLTRADGHALIANSRALQESGISARTETPFGGEILKDSSGDPTGFLVDTAMGLIDPVLPGPPTGADLAKAYETGAEVYARYGWTGIHNMSVDPTHVPLMEALAAEGRLPLRVYNAIDRSGVDMLLSDGPRIGGEGRIVTRAVKLYIDGALGSRGAALHDPYADDPDNRGLIVLSRKEMRPFLQQALRDGIQVVTHAIGDRGNTQLLDLYADAFSAVPVHQREVAVPRWRDEHTQILRPRDIERFAELGVIPSMQPSHAIGDLHFADDRLGLDRLDGAYAWRDLIAAGSIIAGGSDAPVERGDPLIEFYAAVARRDLSGFQGEGWHPEQAVTRQQALKMFTIWAAYAAFQENETGTIEVGKRADLTVFSADIMTVPEAEIPEARALVTVIDGNVVHRAEW